ncbi:DNA-processing protein DprA [Streptococcus sp. DD12]|uniref:DNA-processing protein DprA n=1 Tax=Streptococcus sp. DD12 TaxID=1777880 RepID=UPI000796E84E|nr:DNA-processing protein DprA [Streptococcus sp. DD12]KXT76636.1 Rossmann fold nucleotide-binding protein Smf putatively involved in DNA uptake [Streptococcus sp. DD12]
MNTFELFKLKEAGLSNLNINHLLAYQEREKRHLSLRDMAVVSRVKNPSLFIQSYKQLDLAELRHRFGQFKSFSILDDCYPDALRQIYNPPVLLFYQGDLSLLEAPKLAVVGARSSSQVGTSSVKKILSELQQKFAIVSGLARGIDSAAHMAALQLGCRTIGVIGTGLDGHYPSENRDLQDYLAKHHLVLSEYGPGVPALKYHFPERNRIIAGLSMGVLVCEAKLRSGSLITCERAMEEGRDVFAIPGSLLDGRSDGCHHLIQEGAKLVMSGRDILDEFALS